MSRLWRQELAAFRRARRDACTVCDAPVPLAIAVQVFTYAVGPSRVPGRGVTAKWRTEHRERLAFCPRHLRALKRGDVLRNPDRAIRLLARRPLRTRTTPPRRVMPGAARSSER